MKESAKVTAICMLTLALATPAVAAPIIVTITGVTGEIRVGEGPIFGHSSYQTIPPGAPFVLTYHFDETRGTQSISAVNGDVITESKVENNAASSPGTNAVLQIGTAVWEFGASTRAQVTLNTSSSSKGEQFVFVTQASGNRMAAQIVPAKGGYWPRNGDWRASFLATSLDGSTASFSADNNRVSAKGTLVPQTITVIGVDLDGQWLRAITPDTTNGDRHWQLAHASPRGGYIIEEVTRTILGTVPDGSAISPSFIKYWQAWQVPAGAQVPNDLLDHFSPPGPPGSTGEDKVTVTARFYEGVTLPSSFAAGRLSSITDPNLSASSGTLPVIETVAHHF